jgi:2'-hydroxyisoflavone reductase
MAESRQTGVFNASGAEDGLNMGTMLATCREVSSSDARLVWVNEQFLLDNEVQPWSELPLWIPAAHNGIFEVRNDKALQAGLTFRPLVETVQDTLRWDRGRPPGETLRAGLSRDRERQLLAIATP